MRRTRILLSLASGFGRTIIARTTWARLRASPRRRRRPGGLRGWNLLFNRGAIKSGGDMTKRIWIRRGFLIACGVLLGIGVDRGWQRDVVATVVAQQAKAPLPTMQSLPEEVAR